MQHLSKTDLLTARDHLRVADLALAKCRGIFIRSGAAMDAATVNALIAKLAHLRARIDKALMAKP